ncbi:MAG: c-type cytochrome [Alphaproteobacteria bacterium]|nr:c-type cytochrome [Alphaproteobacteria bacterium]
MNRPCAFTTALILAAGLARAQAAGALGGDVALGEHLSAECVTCHQLSGKAVGAIPPIVGWATDQFVAVMRSYRAKERDNPVMQTITGGLSDEDLAALAAFFGRLTPVAN